MTAIVNVSKPTTAFVNVTSARGGETWASILTTWASETRMWGQCASFLTDVSKPTSTMTNVAKPS